jgi:hypothetical protein
LFSTVIDCEKRPVVIDPVGANASVTVRTVELLIELKLAAIVVCPRPMPVAKPVVLTVATVGADELHVAVLDRFCVLPSL